MIIAFLLIVCILPTSYGALTFPRVMLCSTDSFPQATCTYRTAKGGSFKDCGIYINVTVSVVEDSPTGRRYFSTFINGQDEYCTVWNLEGLIAALDPYSIITFETLTSEGCFII